MTTRLLPALLSLFLAVTSTPALADVESPEAHAKHPTKTITVDNTDIRPGTLMMDQGDVLSFVNYSVHPVQITFTEPKDIEKHIRCGLVRSASDKNPPPAEWALFTWNEGRLVATLPPGRFASVCDLEPGKYAYTATVVAHKQGAEGGTLPAKGQIEVK